MNNISSFFKTYKKELTTIFLFFIATRIIFALMLNIGYYYLPKGYDVYDNVHKPLDIIFQFNDISNFLYIAQNGY